MRYIYGVGITQTPLPGSDAAAIGMAALVVVYAKSLWSLAKHFHVMAHEGMHAITGTILGIRVRKVELKRNGDGATYYRVPPPAAGVSSPGSPATWGPVPSGWPRPGSSASGTSSQSCGWL